MVVQDKMEIVGRKKKERLKLRGDVYWMNKLCGCWTPIRDTKQRKRGKYLENGIDCLRKPKSIYIQREKLQVRHLEGKSSTL
jgi:hypothetical protein